MIEGRHRINKPEHVVHGRHRITDGEYRRMHVIPLHIVGGIHMIQEPDVLDDFDAIQAEDLVFIRSEKYEYIFAE